MTLAGGAAVVHIILLAGYIPLIIGSEAIMVFALRKANRIGLSYTIKVISWIKDNCGFSCVVTFEYHGVV
jgi:hypothetical protein